nr:PREDICTED: calmodulin-binding transcription activator 1-like isoform X1 [Bos indicus]
MEGDLGPEPRLGGELPSDLLLWTLHEQESVSQSVFCGTSTYCVLNTVPPLEDDHGNSNSSHVKIFLPKKLLECLPKCSSLPKERHRWNTNEIMS